MRKTKKISTVWFISYFMILIIPVCINIFVYFATESRLVKQINNYNSQMLENKKQSIDNLIDRVTNTAIDIGLTGEVTKYAERDANYNAADKMDFRRLRETYLNRVIINTKFNSIFVYFPKSDYILGNREDANAYQYFLITNTNLNRQADYNEWLHTVINRPSNGFFLYQKKLFYKYCPLGAEFYGENCPAIFIELDPSLILNSKDNQDIFMVLNTDDTVFLSNTDAVGESFVMKDQKNYQEKFNGTKYVISWVTSQSYNWKYVYLAPTNIYLNEANDTRNIMWVSMFLCLLTGFALIFFSIRQNNRPVKLLVEKLKGYERFNSTDLNEYQYLDKVIMDTISRNEEYSDRLEGQKRLLRDSILAKLLKGTYYAGDDLALKLQSFGIKFTNDSFAVALFYIDNVDNIFFEANHESNKQFEQAVLIVMNIMEEMLKRKFIAHMFECDDTIACIINASQKDANTIEEISDIIREGQMFILENFNFEFTVALSGLHYSVEGLDQIYEEAISALEFKFVLPKQKLILYTQLDTMKKIDYYYPLELEEGMINCFKRGDKERCREILNSILDANFSNAQPSVPLVKCLIFDIAGTFIKSINSLGTNSSMIYQNMNFVERLTDCNTVNDMRQEMMTILNEIFQYIGCDETEAEGAEAVRQVKKYVNRHYTDPALNVSSIAEKLNFNPNYISGIFKKNSGIGLLEYITKVRVNKAKELLSKTDNTLEVISSLVGYTNSRTFFRVFSKYQGISPGKYRKVVKGYDGDPEDI